VTTQNVSETSNIPHWTTSLKLNWNSYTGTEKITKTFCTHLLLLKPYHSQWKIRGNPKKAA